MERLGDVATYINGYAFKPSDWSDEGLEIIRIQNLTGNAYEINRFKGEYNKKYEVNNGDVLISWSASLGVYVWNKGKAILNQHIFKVVFDKIDVNKDFFIFQVENLLERASSEVHGATMKHLTKPVFDSLPFYLPNKEKQNAIACELKAVCSLITKHREQLEDYDLLVKSRFIEMFEGKDYPQKRLSDVCNKITDGTHKTPIYLNEGVVFISAKNIIDGKLNFEDIKYISEEEYQGIQKRCQIEKGDVLLTKSGSLGMTAIVETDEPLGLFESLAVLKYNRSLLKGIFLCTQMQSDAIQTQLMSNIKGVAVKHLHLNVISSTKVIVPPLDVQESFSLFVAQVDKSKLALQESLDKLEKLQKALIKKYLG